MAKTKQELEEDAISTVLKHSGELNYADLSLRGGEGLASTLLIMVRDGKVLKRQTDGSEGTLYSLPISVDNPTDIILRIVENKPGIKSIELVTEVLCEIYSKGGYEDKNLSDNSDNDVVIETINNLVASDDLMEVEYILPSMDYRIKSLYFPKGTKITLPNQ